jgi:hypothetical protein
VAKSWRDRQPYKLFGEATLEYAHSGIDGQEGRDRFVVGIQPLLNRLVHMQLKFNTVWREDWMDDVVSYVNIQLLGSWWPRYSSAIHGYVEKDEIEDPGLIRSLLRWFMSSVYGYVLNYLNRYRYPDNSLSCECVYHEKSPLCSTTVDRDMDREVVHATASCVARHHVQSRAPRGERNGALISKVAYAVAEYRMRKHYADTGEML